MIPWLGIAAGVLLAIIGLEVVVQAIKADKDIVYRVVLAIIGINIVTLGWVVRHVAVPE
jgi:hypothetical protein